MTLTALYLEIPGRPVPLQRPRFAYRNAKTKPWAYNIQYREMADVKKLMKAQYPYAPITDPVYVFFEFNYKVPKMLRNKLKKAALDGRYFLSKECGYFARRPDLSNLVKFYEDCMNDLILEDDALIVKSESIKLYAEEDKTKIWIRSMTDQQIEDQMFDRLYNAV